MTSLQILTMDNEFSEKLEKIRSVVSNEQAFNSFMASSNFETQLSLAEFCSKHPSKECEKFIELFRREI